MFALRSGARAHEAKVGIGEALDADGRSPAVSPARSALGKSLRRAARLLAGACLLALPGCAGSMYLPEKPEGLLPDRSASLLPGSPGREAVHTALGGPAVSSRYWRFDLFRETTTQAEVLVACVPWPVPFARFADDLHRYTLVAYDEAGVAAGISSGLYRESPRWREPVQTNYRTLLLRAGELSFLANEFGQTEALVASPGRRDAYLQRAGASASCTLVLGCGESWCGHTVSVDQEPPLGGSLRWVLRDFDEGDLKPWKGSDVEAFVDKLDVPRYEVLRAIRLTPGEYVLSVSEGRWEKKQSIPLPCRPGQVLYAVLESVPEGREQGGVRLGAELPSAFTARSLVLYEGGRWLVEPEP